MRLRWPVWGGRATRRPAHGTSVDDVTSQRRRRGRSASRPRVARAAEAARAAQSWVSAPVNGELARVWWSRESGPLVASQHTHAQSDASAVAGLLWAETRRTQAWQAIDATLGQLRAS